MNIYLASNNLGKIKEISKCFPNSKIFSEKDIEKMLNIKINIEETGKTFSENSKLKAESMAKILEGFLSPSDMVIADDSGILIPSLPDILGVYTKRQMLKWCEEKGQNTTENDFYNYISSIAKEPKTCIFQAVIAVITNGTCNLYKGELIGTLANSCRGENGFGFDPIFEVNQKTLAEMSNEEKEAINPRITAIQQMKRDLT